MEKKAGKKKSSEHTNKATAEKAPSEVRTTKNVASEKKSSESEESVTVSSRKTVSGTKRVTRREETVGGPKKQCTIPSCKREYRAKGYCKAHYRKWRHNEFGHARYKTCKDFACHQRMALNRHGFCEEHFQNYYVKGLAQSRIAAAAPAKEVKAADKVA